MSRKILTNRTYSFKKKKIKSVEEYFSKYKSVIKVRTLQIHESGDCTGIVFQRVGQFVYAFIFNLEMEVKGCELTTYFYEKIVYNEKQLTLFGDELDRIENKRIGDLCDNYL